MDRTLTRMAAPDEVHRVEADGASIPLEIYLPSTRPAPAVLVVHEIWGLNDDIRGIARRFADEGFVAGTPDLANGRHWTCLTAALVHLTRGKGRSVSLLAACSDALEAREDTTQVGAVGFCMGGGFALLLGVRGKARVAGNFYGETRPKEALSTCCPVLGGFGAKDVMFAGKGRRLKADLDALGIDNDIVVYDQAGHSFMNDPGSSWLTAMSAPLMRVGYQRDAAEDSWRRMLPFFRKHLGATPS